MQNYTTYSSQQQRHPRRRLLVVVVLAIALLVVVFYGGRMLLHSINDQKVRSVSKSVVTKLTEEGTYASIKPYLAADFLGELSEPEYDSSAKMLTNLKGSKIEVLNSTEKGTFGTITASKPEQKDAYSFGFFVSVEKTGINSYKVTNIETDYGRQSYFEDK